MNKEDINIAVICGGESAEAEVSRVSARSVATALKANYPRVTLMELDETLAGRMVLLVPDVVFPVLHGPPGEDGTIQGFLDIWGVPYVGSDVHASACAMDKIVSKQLFKRAGLPLAEDVILDEPGNVARGVAEVLDQLGERVVVKPACQGSALGVQLIDNSNQLHDAIEQAYSYDGRILVERRIIGREITCGILERHGVPEAHPVIEIVTPENTWYDYEHRYTKGFSDHLIPAALGDELNLRIQQISLQAHRALGCRDLSRADFVVTDSGEVFLLEVNNLPGMTPTSLYPDGAAAMGISFEELVSILIDNALRRGRRFWQRAGTS